MNKPTVEQLNEILDAMIEQSLNSTDLTVSQAVSMYASAKEEMLKAFEDEDLDENEKRFALELQEQCLNAFKKYPGELLVKDIPKSEMKKDIVQAIQKVLGLDIDGLK